MVTTMQTGVVLQAVDGPHAFTARAARIAELGYDRLWLTDSSLHTASPWSYLTLAAGAAPRLTLGTAVTNPVTRHPAIVAVEAATLAEVSDGRFTLGIGVGDRPLRALGLANARVDDLDQSIDAIRRLLAGERVTGSAGPHRLVDAELRHPTQQQVPVFVAASGPRTLELAGRVADGVILLCGLDPVAIDWALAHVDRGAAAAGRPRPHIALFAYGAVHDDEQAALAAARSIAAWFPQTAPVYCDLLGLDPAVAERVRASYSGGEFQEAAVAAAEIPDAFVAQVALCESPDRAADRLRRLAAAGVSSVNVFPLGDRRDETIEGFAAARRTAGL
ncbi:MAG TPA: LLM class flavin-dependent oxidoreductase [Cellulomonas sp.]